MDTNTKDWQSKRLTVSIWCRYSAGKILVFEGHGVFKKEKHINELTAVNQPKSDIAKNSLTKKYLNSRSNQTAKLSCQGEMTLNQTSILEPRPT